MPRHCLRSTAGALADRAVFYDPGLWRGQVPASLVPTVKLFTLALRFTRLSAARLLGKTKRHRDTTSRGRLMLILQASVPSILLLAFGHPSLISSLASFTRLLR